jgi:MATE family multidrug resistance protein
MLPSLRDLRQEFQPMFALALPVVLAEMGWMVMGIVDTLMVGRLSPEAIGAVGIGSSVFLGVAIFAMGLTLGLDTLVSHAYGAGRIESCHRWLHHGIALSALLTPPIMLALYTLSNSMSRWGMTPSVLTLTKPYLDVLTWSVPALLLYSTFRRYLQGMGVVRPVMVALVSANIVNAVGNWIFIFGKLGAPALGVRGSAWATVLARIGMAAYLAAVIVYRGRRPRRAARTDASGRIGSLSPSVKPSLFDTPVRIELSLMRQLVSLGSPPRCR